MQVRLITTAAVVASLVATFALRDAQAYDYTAPVVFHTVANFDPANGVVPFPNNLLFNGTTDLTLNIPVDPTAADAGPKLAMNALDGFSTSAPWSMTFSQPITPSTLVGGQTVRMFEVTLSGPAAVSPAVKRELASPQEFVVASAPSDTTGRTLAIVPTKPLKQMTSYMAVVTNGVSTASGPVRGSFTYQLGERTSPLCTGGQSTLPALSAAQACALEPLRQLINSQEAAAASAGVAPRFDRDVVGRDDAEHHSEPAGDRKRDRGSRRRRPRMSRRPARRLRISVSACRRSPTSTSARSTCRTT